MNTQNDKYIQDKYIQSLFKEGEHLATMQKTLGALSLDDLAQHILDCIDCKWMHHEDEEYITIKEVLRVYQGFLDNGGIVDFTERR